PLASRLLPTATTTPTTAPPSLHDALPIYRQSNASPIVFNFFLQEHNAAYSAGIAPWQKTPEERDLPCSYAYIFTYASNAACFQPDRKSTRLNSSHVSISYAVFCLKKKSTD